VSACPSLPIFVTAVFVTAVHCGRRRSVVIVYCAHIARDRFVVAVRVTWVEYLLFGFFMRVVGVSRVGTDQLLTRSDRPGGGNTAGWLSRSSSFARPGHGQIFAKLRIHTSVD